MIQTAIQIFILCVVLSSAWITSKIFGDRIKGLKLITLCASLLLLSSLGNLIGAFFISLALLIVGTIYGVLGMINLYKELNKSNSEKFTAKDILKTISENLRADDALLLIKDAAVFKTVSSLRENDLKLETSEKINGENSSKLFGKYTLFIPIKDGDETLGAIVLCSSRKIKNFDSNKFNFELYAIELYLKNLHFQNSLKSLEAKCESIQRSTNEHIAFIAHELKRPLTAVIGFAEILRSEFKNLSDDEIIEFIDNIKKSGEKLLATVQKLNDLNRSEKVKSEIKAKDLQPS